VSTWGLTIEHVNGTVYAAVTTAQSVDMNFPLNAPSEVSLTIAHNSQEAAAVYSLIASTMPVLRVTRDGTTVFYGPMADCDSTLDDQPTMSLRFTDWVGSWESCYRFDFGGSGGFTPSDPRAFIELLTLETTVFTYTFGSSGATVKSPLTYGELLNNYTYSGLPPAIPDKASMSLLDLINQMSALDDGGFEWYVGHDTSVDKPILQMDETVGTDKSTSVLFGHGNDLGKQTMGNCSYASVTYMPPLNYVYTTGNDDGRNSEAKNDGSISSFGERGILGESQIKKGVADEKGFDQIRTNPRQMVTLTADPEIAPQPWTDYYLGDTVRVTVKRDSFSLDSSYKVNNISIGLDENLEDTAHNLSFEIT